MLLVEVGGHAVKCWPLNIMQNVICICIGFSSIPFGFVLKFVPLKYWQWMNLEPKFDEDEEEPKKGFATSLKSLGTTKSRQK